MLTKKIDCCKIVEENTKERKGLYGKQKQKHKRYYISSISNYNSGIINTCRNKHSSNNKHRIIHKSTTSKRRNSKKRGRRTNSDEWVSRRDRPICIRNFK